MDTRLEDDFADLIDDYQHDLNILNQAVEAFIASLNKLRCGDAHFPTHGWDYETARAHVEELRPNVRAKELERWAADELLEREFK